MAEIPDKVTVITEQNMVACLSVIQTDIRYIKEKLDSSIDDHETRIRCLEQREEDCKQVVTLNKLTELIDNHETRINNLEDINHQESGAKVALDDYREYIGWGLAGVLALISVYQFLKGEI